LSAGIKALADSTQGFAHTQADGSRLQYGKHTSKKDRHQMTHAKDIGYELQSSLLVDHGRTSVGSAFISKVLDVFTSRPLWIPIARQRWSSCMIANTPSLRWT
jgi:hypothetical protein